MSPIAEWARPYLPAFREVARHIGLLAGGFALVPVEVAGRDVATALAAWLEEERGLAVGVHAGDWASLVPALLRERAKPFDAFVVIGDRDARAGAAEALRALNQRRDVVAKKLPCPLLWCGPPEFQRLAWERAPDLWSVRAMTVRVEAPGEASQEAPMWPISTIGEPPERTRELFLAAKRQKDARNAARLGETLAEALIARGELAEAERTLRGLARAKLATARARMLEGMVLAMRGRADAARARFAGRESGAGPDEPRWRICEANLLVGIDHARARALYDEALAGARTNGDRRALAFAVAGLGTLALREGAYDDAAARLEEAAAMFAELGDAADEARARASLGSAHLAWRDARRACEHLEEALDAFRALRDQRGEADVLRRLARAYLAVGDPQKAHDDAARALTIARAAGYEDEPFAADARAIVRRAEQELSIRGG